MSPPVGTGLIVNGRRETVPGIRVVNYLDDPRLRLTMGQDGRPRGNHPVSLIVEHTTKGEPQTIKPGFGVGVNAGLRTAEHWREDTDRDGSYHQGGAHLTIDFDGTVYQHADVAAEATFNANATPVNWTSIAIETYQGGKYVSGKFVPGSGTVYDGQLKVTAALTRWLAERFGLPGVYQWPYVGPVAYIAAGNARGVVGHRDVTKKRGEWDPGGYVYGYLRAVGFSPHNFQLGSPPPGVGFRSSRGAVVAMVGVGALVLGGLVGWLASRRG